MGQGRDPQDEYTLAQIQASPMMHEPLTKLQVAPLPAKPTQCCPTSDGGAAALVVSEEFVHARGLEDRAVEIVAMEMSTDLPSALEGKSSIKAAGFDMTKNAVEKLYKKSGLSPDDLQVVELHDCFSANGLLIPHPSLTFLAELVTYEALGLCPRVALGPS